MSISIIGSNFNGATEVDFGQGINIDSFNIDNPSQITANVSITLEAAVGTRDVSVTTPGGIATLTSGFTVEELLSPPPAPNQQNQTQIQNQTQNQTIDRSIGQGTGQGEQTGPTGLFLLTPSVIGAGSILGILTAASMIFFFHRSRKK